ncbi:MAG: hypothetical protein ABW086_08585 [Sedimenticola sp.]
MFGSFFKSRIRKDLEKLEETREKCVAVMRAKGVSETEIGNIDELSYQKAMGLYTESPDASEAITVYCESLISEAADRGYDIR